MQQEMIRPFDCIARNFIHNSMQLSPSPTCKSDHLGTQPILILTFMILNNRSMVMVMINVKRVVIEQRLNRKFTGILNLIYQHKFTRMGMGIVEDGGKIQKHFITYQSSERHNISRYDAAIRYPSIHINFGEIS